MRMLRKILKVVALMWLTGGVVTWVWAMSQEYRHWDEYKTVPVFVVSAVGWLPVSLLTWPFIIYVEVGYRVGWIDPHPGGHRSKL